MIAGKVVSLGSKIISKLNSYILMTVKVIITIFTFLLRLTFVTSPPPELPVPEDPTVVIAVKLNTAFN